MLSGDTASARPSEWTEEERRTMNIEIILAIILQFISLFEALADIIGFNLPLFQFGGE
jgi:hypothetical protein